MLSPTDIRERLRTWVSAHLSNSPEDVLIDELGFVNQQIGKTIDASFRADLALANGRLVGFEIKSGADTLKRWPSQCQAYFNVFDEVWLCTHGRHLEKALAITPKEAGVILVDDLGGVAMLRSAKRNGSLSSYDLSGLLWREELDELCSMNGLRTLSKETKAQVRAKVSDGIPLEAIRNYVISRLKYRKRNLDEII